MDNSIILSEGTSIRIKGKTTDLILSPYKRKSSNYKQNVWTITDSYILYKKELGPAALDKKLYIKIMKEIFADLSKDIIRDIPEVVLPYRLGKIGIKKRRNNRVFNKQQLDYGKYNSSKTKLYHTNSHTNKYYFFWDWETKDGAALFTNQKCYKFTPARGNDNVVGKRGLASWIKYCAETPTIKDYDRLIKR